MILLMSRRRRAGRSQQRVKSNPPARLRQQLNRVTSRALVFQQAWKARVGAWVVRDTRRRANIRLKMVRSLATVRYLSLILIVHMHAFDAMARHGDCLLCVESREHFPKHVFIVIAAWGDDGACHEMLTTRLSSLHFPKHTQPRTLNRPTGCKYYRLTKNSRPTWPVSTCLEFSALSSSPLHSHLRLSTPSSSTLITRQTSGSLAHLDSTSWSIVHSFTRLGGRHNAFH